jgi:outer membrane lipoprotein-sorting protein
MTLVQTEKRRLTKAIKMLKTTLILFTSLFLCLTGWAQDFTKAADSDPEAHAILEAVKKKYDGYQSVEASFALDIELPEQPVETQEGKLARSGKQYRVEFNGQEAFSDGEALYLILHGNKSVQINNLPEPGEDTGMFSPEAIFNFYENGQFVYSLIDTRAEGRKVMQYIEFKPVDRSSEYAKLRMVVERDTKSISRVMAFAKDGSRYTFRLLNVNANKSFPAGTFSYQESRYPGYYVEDLRY